MKKAHFAIAVFVLSMFVACTRRDQPPQVAREVRSETPALASFRITVNHGQVTVVPLDSDGRVAQFIDGLNSFDATVQSSPDASTPASVGTTYLLHPDVSPSFNTSCNSSPYGDTGVPGSFQGVCQSWSVWNPHYELESVRTYVEVTSVTNNLMTGAITTYNTVSTDSELTVTNTAGLYSYGVLQPQGSTNDHASVNWYFATPEPGSFASFSFTVNIRAIPIRQIFAAQQGDTTGGSTGLFCPPDPNYGVSVSRGNINFAGSGTGPVYVAYVSTDSHCGSASTSHPQVVRARVDGSSVTLVSHATSGATTGSNGVNTGPVISSDGTIVAWESTSTDLIGSTDDLGVADGNGSGRDIYVRSIPLDAGSEQTVIGSADLFSMASVTGDDARHPVLTLDGAYLAWDTPTNLKCLELDASDYTSCDGDAYRDVYVRDLWGTGLLSLVSTSTGTRSADAEHPSISTNGVCAYGSCDDAFLVSFDSTDSVFVSGDTNGVRDVFVRDVTNAVTRRESVRSGGGQTSCASDQAELDMNGGYIVFRSCDTGMVGSTTTTGRTHVYHKQLGTASSLFRGDGQVASGSESNADADLPQVEQGGRLIAFRSASTNLITYPLTISPSGQAQMFMTDVRATDPARQRTWIISQSYAQYDSLAPVGAIDMSPSGFYGVFIDSASSGMPTLASGVASGSYVIEVAPLR